MSADKDRAELHDRIDSLTPMGVRFVGRLVDSLSSPPQSGPSASSWLATPDWLEYFGYSLASHHGVATEHLAQTGFEVAFRDTCSAVGWDASDPGSATQRFVDMEVTAADKQLRKLSLKSTGAKKLSKTTAHISKLTEAAWIQDMRSARDRRDKTQELFREYRKAVDAIIYLRAFREPGKVPSKYQLLEIPAAIFDSIQQAPLDAFAADGPTIDCSYKGEPVAARVSLDRSDAKVTVKQIKLSVCTVHAEWELSS